eukprot:TRINITY_DN1102_c0_g1_i3.p1 TRINITY_DN1102_c0_g1~~TRINITY_DN1102_c0_g1_i3.p1  ORF type:complete len:129 (-),score=20.08 TRINITY_DN1102_c0_g1_i3:60-446(-)
MSFERQLVDKFTVLELGNGKAVYEFTVDEVLANAFGSLHGGVTATIIDVFTTYALLTVGDLPGVSIEINVSYISAAPINTIVVVQCDVIKKGRSFAFLECVLKDKNDPTKIYAKGRHVKYLNPPPAKL